MKFKTMVYATLLVLQTTLIIGGPSEYIKVHKCTDVEPLEDKATLLVYDIDKTLTDPPTELIDPQVISQIEQYKKSCLAVLGLTSWNIKNKEGAERRSTQLTNLGIHFSSDFRNTTFDMKNYEGYGISPELYDGTLFSTGFGDKGEVLEVFLTLFNLCPSRVVFFDDSDWHLKTVGDTCRKRGIQYTPYWCDIEQKWTPVPIPIEMYIWDD